jgi:hypothetical protein
MKNSRWTPAFLKALLLSTLTIFCLLLLLDRFHLSRGVHAALTGLIVFAVLLLFMAKPFRSFLSTSSSGASGNVQG